MYNFFPDSVRPDTGTTVRPRVRVPRACLRSSQRRGHGSLCSVPHCWKAPRCRESLDAPCFPLVSQSFQPISSIGAARVHGTTPIAAPAPALRAGDRCPPGVGHPGMAPRRAHPGWRAAPGFARGTFISLQLPNVSSLSLGKNKSTASFISERSLFHQLL